MILCKSAPTQSTFTYIGCRGSHFKVTAGSHMFCRFNRFSAYSSDLFSVVSVGTSCENLET